jgi:hypothetical protein
MSVIVFIEVFDIGQEKKDSFHFEVIAWIFSIRMTSMAIFRPEILDFNVNVFGKLPLLKEPNMLVKEAFDFIILFVALVNSCLQFYMRVIIQLLDEEVSE